MSWNDKALFAPESLLTPDGRRVMWAWILGTSGQCLPRELSLSPGGTVGIKPLSELESLRQEKRTLSNVAVKKGSLVLLDDIKGHKLELELRIQPTKADRFGVNLHSDETGEKSLKLVVDKKAKILNLGNESAPFELSENELSALSRVLGGLGSDKL